MESEELASREKNLSRNQILAKKKAMREIMKEASFHHQDYLSYFPEFRNCNKNGLSLYLESGRGDKLTSSSKRYIQILLKVNMEGPYGSEWPNEEKVKRMEMISPEARYIYVYDAKNENLELQKASMVGFVHYRFVIEEEVPVLYLYELQLEARVQKKGLGEYLMQLIELIAQKSQMGAVVLTVQKANSSAIDFYIRKLSYRISTISPSRVDPLNKLGKSYEILCKTFGHEAKEILELLSPSVN